MHTHFSKELLSPGSIPSDTKNKKNGIEWDKSESQKGNTKSYTIRAEALVQWLWEKTDVQEVVSLKSSNGYWMDIFCIDVLKRQKEDKKMQRMAHFKKKQEYPQEI